MATYKVTGPDGGTYKITVPDPQPTAAAVPEGEEPGLRPLAGQPAIPIVPVAAGARERPVGQRESPGIIPVMGEAVGAGIGTMIPPQTLTVPAMATGGALIGTSLESLLSKGRFPTLTELRNEAAWTLAPEAVQTGVKAAKTPLQRAFQRAVAEKRLPLIHSTAGGRVLREAEQFRRASGQGPRIFNAPSNAVVDAAFDGVRASGVKVPAQQLMDGLDLLTAPERKVLRREIDQADAILNTRLNQPGSRTLRTAFAQVEEAMDAPTPRGRAGFTPTPAPAAPLPDLDIGEMQDMRSALRARASSVSGPTADVLLAFSNKIDRAILDTLDPARAASEQAAGQLTAARDGYRRLKAAESLQDYFMLKSSLPTGKGNVRTLRLASLRDELEKNLTTRAMEINHNLDTVPGARARLEKLISELAPLGSQINTPIGSDTGGVSRNAWLAGLFRGISEAVLLTDRGLELFLDVAKQQKGTITPNQLAIIVNQVRRELEPAPASSATRPQ